MSTFIGLLVIVALALVLYASSRGADHSIAVQRKRPGEP
jgi:hypothetical protein